MFITGSGAYYRQYLPHYRSPGAIYHCRFSLDSKDKSLWLTDDWMFEIIEDSILTEHKKQSLIHAYVIMADHTHVLIQPLPKQNNRLAWCDYREFYHLEHIAGRIKGRSSYRINRRIGRNGKLWQDESYDRVIRGGADLEETIDYIHHNPVRWELVSSPEQYRWSSLRTIYSGEKKYYGWFDLDEEIRHR